VLHKWYGVVERISFKSTVATAMARMVVDQATIAPGFLYVFFWLNGGLQGFSPATIKKNIRRDYKDVLIANYQVTRLKNQLTRIVDLEHFLKLLLLHLFPQLWPAVQIVNFSLVPLAHRVVFAQVSFLEIFDFHSRLLSHVP